MGCPSVFKGIIIIFFGTNPSSLKYPGTMGEPFCVRNNIVFRSEKVCWGLEEDVPVKILWPFCWGLKKNYVRKQTCTWPAIADV
jgi:hypothetical protein